MFFTKKTALALTAFLTATTAAPLKRGQTSASMASLPKPVLAPYYNSWGNTGIAKLSEAHSAPGLDAVTLGFITASGPGKCEITTEMDGLADGAAAFIAQGGVVNLSFGGWINDGDSTHAHVQQACSDEKSLAALIQKAMDKFNTHNVEFDIEADYLMNDGAARERLAKALAIVKGNNPDLYITYTLGGTPQGLPDTGMAQLKAAKDAGVTVDVLSIMTMDMGVDDPSKASQTAITGGAAQYTQVFGGNDGFSHVGVIPEIGVDDQGKMLDVPAAKELGAFAAEKGIAYVSYWSITRDFPGGVGEATSEEHSGAPGQSKPYDFFNAFKSAFGSGHAPSPSQSPSTTQAPPSSATNVPTQAPSTTAQPGNSGGDCSKSYTVKAGDTCSSVTKANGLSLEDFLAENPQIDSDCSNLQLNQSYCIATGSGGAPVSTPASTPVSTPVSTPASTPSQCPPITPAAPAPDTSASTQAPEATSTAGNGGGDCGKSYTVKAGDYCQKVADANGISLQDFLAKNPSVDANCSNLQIGQSYCVA